MPFDLPLETVAGCITRRRLHLILLPTEACNFRCVYCYETFRQKRMIPFVVEAVKRLIRRRIPGLDDLEISWFGGEPLLARDIIEDVLRDAREHGRTAPGLRIWSDVTTNAYLLSRDVFQRLLGLGLASYQISFDGPREHHDRKRVLAGGKGTFDRIWENVTAMARVPGRFHVLVRVHVDRENEEAVPEFIEMFQKSLGADSRFELFLRPLSRLGGPGDGGLAVFDPAEARVKVDRLRAYASGRGVRLGPRSTTIPICYAAAGNSFVVRSDGRLNKCTVALEDPRNQVGRILPDGSLQIDAPMVAPWMRGLKSGVRADLSCPMKGLARPGVAVTA